MAKDEMDIAYFYNVIKSQRKFILATSISLFVIVLLVAIFYPKSYESTAVVQLASVGVAENPFIFNQVESKAILGSTEIVMPGFEYYNSKYPIDIKDFKEKHLDISLVKEVVGRDEQIGGYLTVVVKARDAETAQKVNKMIVDSFLNYVTPYYNRTILVYYSDLNQTKSFIDDTQSQIDLVESQLGKNSNSISSASDILLLTRNIADYRAQLIQAQAREITIETAIAGRKAFRLVGEPDLPEKYSSPPVLIIILAGLIMSVIVALIFAFLREELHRNL